MSQAAHLRELTAGGRGAIRVLALEGEGVRERLAPFLAGRQLPEGTFARVTLREPDGSLLDEAIVVVESEQRLELHLHGSPTLVERVRARLAGPEPEQPPTTLEERAELRLEHAPSELAARVLLDQAEGALRAEFERLAASADDELVRGARVLGERARRARWLLNLPRVVLAGPVNAGKSTLFNLLVGRERVVVSASPGTTRDIVHERARLGALLVDLYDTAGTRALDPEQPLAGVEEAGQHLAREWCASADLVLWLAPATCAAPLPALERMCVLHTLGDLDPERAHRRHQSLSALHAPEEARQTVVRSVEVALDFRPGAFEPGCPVPFEEQHATALSCAQPSELRRLLAGWLARQGGCAD